MWFLRRGRGVATGLARPSMSVLLLVAVIALACIAGFLVVSSLREESEQAHEGWLAIRNFRALVHEQASAEWEIVGSDFPDPATADDLESLTRELDASLAGLTSASSYETWGLLLRGAYSQYRQALADEIELIRSRRPGAARSLAAGEVAPSFEALETALSTAEAAQQADVSTAARAADWGSLVVLAIGVLILAAAVHQFETGRSNTRPIAVSSDAFDAGFRSIVQSASVVISVVDADGTLRYVSPSASAMFHRSPPDLMGRSIAKHLDEADAPRVLDAVALVAERGGTMDSLEYGVRRGDGTAIHVSSSIAPLGGDPHVSGVVMSTQDITDRKALEAQLEHSAFHDSLTDLPNRSLFRDRLSTALTRSLRTEESVAVIFMDLDDFKAVNDTLGHEIGDGLLIAVAERLQGVVRPTDTVARLGGDEFGVLVTPVADSQEAIVVASRIVQALSRPFAIHDREVYGYASLGVVVPPPEGAEAEELLRNADIAMYAAKRRKAHSFELFQPSMLKSSLGTFTLAADLGGAISRDELMLHYQPIVETESSTIVGFEALLRWKRAGDGLLLPASFRSVAEGEALMVPIGRWVLEQACAQVGVWRRLVSGDGAPFVSVNISSRQLRHSGFVRDVMAALDRPALDPSALVLEIREASYNQCGERGAAALQSLRDRGVRVAVDEFGAGQSSLATVANVAADITKIDHTLIDDVKNPDSAGALIEATITLARRLGMQTAAVGVERAEQLALVKGQGCELVQGYLLASPQPPDDISRLLREYGARVDAWPDDAKHEGRKAA